MPYSPFLTHRFDLAFHLASGLHHAQPRKGSGTPYIAHLMSVAALVLESGGDEDLAIAALLHDAVEDQGGLPTLETIRHLFGDRVAGVVRECSDSESTDPNKKLPWHQRKQAYLEHLRSASPDTLLVSVADKLHNARAILGDYRSNGDEVWRRFSREASKADHLNYYRTLVTIFRQTAAPVAMVNELDRVVCELEGLSLREQEQSRRPRESALRQK
jgi:(p)ppGpp synthase/HD superfamily hydrolase